MRGQSKMAVYVSKKRRVEDSVDSDIVLLLSRMIKARLLIDFKYYREMQDLERFTMTWTHGEYCALSRRMNFCSQISWSDLSVSDLFFF